MRKVIILSGISGSGKSTFADRLRRENPDASSNTASADHYFMGKDGVYRFDPKKLDKAHESCFITFLNAIQTSTDLVIVDNTNLSTYELSPYVLAARAFGYQVEIHTLHCSVEAAVKRNNHNVPLHAIERQYSRLRERHLPFGWKNIDHH